MGASVTPRRGASHLISGAVVRRKVAAMMKGRGLSRRKRHKLRREGRREGADEEGDGLRKRGRRHQQGGRHEGVDNPEVPLCNTSGVTSSLST